MTPGSGPGVGVDLFFDTGNAMVLALILIVVFTCLATYLQWRQKRKQDAFFQPLPLG